MWEEFGKNEYCRQRCPVVPVGYAERGGSAPGVSQAAGAVVSTALTGGLYGLP